MILYALFHMTVQWHVSDTVRDNALAHCLGSIESCFALKGKPVSSDPRSTVSFHTVNGQSFYVKRYTASGKYLRKYFGRSRVRAEWENLQFFQSLGIAALDILAYGEEYRDGRFVRGALVTATLENAIDLEKLAKDKSRNFFDRQYFRSVAKQVAEYTRVMHKARFAHNDLDWRNILVADAGEKSDSSGAIVHFFDCPGGRRWCWPFLEYRIIKDLAHLDKIACQCLPLRWRIWFYYQYVGRNKLTKKDRERLKNIRVYYKEKLED